MTPFKTGQRVRHKVSGEKGDVVKIEPANTVKGKYSMVVENDNGGATFALDDMFEIV